jgi:hypothetical protein
MDSALKIQSALKLEQEWWGQRQEDPVGSQDWSRLIQDSDLDSALKIQILKIRSALKSEQEWWRRRQEQQQQQQVKC